MTIAVATQRPEAPNLYGTIVAQGTSAGTPENVVDWYVSDEGDAVTASIRVPNTHPWKSTTTVLPQVFSDGALAPISPDEHDSISRLIESIFDSESIFDEDKLDEGVISVRRMHREGDISSVAVPTALARAVQFAERSHIYAATSAYANRLTGISNKIDENGDAIRDGSGDYLAINDDLSVDVSAVADQIVDEIVFCIPADQTETQEA